jgi:hypothetical protein
MQCREVRDLLDSFLSEELLVETNHELMRHLETCVECRAELEGRRSVRAALRRAFTNHPSLQPRPRFREEMLDAVRASASRRRARSSTTWAGIAAALVLIVGAAAFVMLRGRVPSEVRDAVGDHRNCALKFQLSEKPITLAEAAARYGPVYARLQEVPQELVSTDAGPLRVRDRHSCVFAGRRYGHVVLQIQEHLVSFLVTDSTRASIWNAQAAAGEITRRVDGQLVSSFELSPQHTAFVVSDLDEGDFRAVARALAASVSNRLAFLMTGFDNGFRN